MTFKKSPKILLCGLMFILVAFKATSTFQIVNQDNFVYELYYSDELDAGTVIKWNFTKFNVQGFSNSKLREYPIEKGTVVELKIEKSLKSFDVRYHLNNKDSNDIPDPNDYFHLKIDEKILKLSNQDRTINFYFDAWISYSYKDSKGNNVYTDVILFENLVFLYPIKIDYKNSTVLNKFEFENTIHLSNEYIIEDENVSKSTSEIEIQIDKSTGIVKYYTEKYQRNFPTYDLFSIEIEYELLSNETNNLSSNELENFIFFGFSGTIGIIIGVTIAKILRKSKMNSKL